MKSQVVADLSFVSENEIRKLNKKHRKIDKPTDVLSFPLDQEQGPDGVIRLGDIVICKRQAQKKGHKIPFLIKHGMLHLLGVHHK
jgi:probable rRNA maturation factor